MRSNNATHATMQRTMHEALVLHSCGVIILQLLAPNVRKKRAERGLKLLFRLKGRDATIGDITLDPRT